MNLWDFLALRLSNDIVNVILSYVEPNCRKMFRRCAKVIGLDVESRDSGGIYYYSFFNARKGVRKNFSLCSQYVYKVCISGDVHGLDMSLKIEYLKELIDHFNKHRANVST